jgi:hypothetical protein
MPVLESAKTLPPSAFFLTTRTLGELGSFRGQVPAQLEQAKRLLTETQEKIFLPFLTQTRPDDLPQRFEWGANSYAPIRLYILSLLWAGLGTKNFELRYFAALVKATDVFVNEAEKWGLAREDVEQTFQQYLSSATRIVLVAEQIGSLDAPTLVTLIGNITKTDFGLTAMALVLEGSINAERWIVQETFAFARSALADYAASVNALLHSVQPKHSVSNSLKVEGDLDHALQEFSSAFRSLLRKKENPQ